MTRNELIDRIGDAVFRYLDDFDQFEPNPQLTVNPVTLYADVVSGGDMLKDLAEGDEAIEDAAASEGAASDEYTDRQVHENLDYYPIRQFLHVRKGHPTVANPDAIARLAARYIP